MTFPTPVPTYNMEISQYPNLVIRTRAFGASTTTISV